MILPDLNLLLYAYNPHIPQHERACAWWEQALNGDELIGLPHELLFGFIRIATHPRLGGAAASLEAACKVVDSWLELPQVKVLFPDARHFARVVNLLQRAQARGSLVSDAILAAYALEHRACLCTNDADFARFPGLNWKNPLLDR